MWYLVTRNPQKFHRLTGDQRNPLNWGVTNHWHAIHLQNLVTVSLEYCARCTTLSLGGLLHLKKLYINEMHELKELIYDQELENHVSSLALLEISNCPRLTTLPSCFPNLEDLKIKGCDSLKALTVKPVLKGGCPKVEIGEERRRAHREIEIQSVINTDSSPGSSSLHLSNQVQQG